MGAGFALLNNLIIIPEKHKKSICSFFMDATVQTVLDKKTICFQSCQGEEKQNHHHLF